MNRSRAVGGYTGDGRRWGLWTLLCLLGSPAFAAHPLITDDTGTQGRRKLQLEISGESSIDRAEVDGVHVQEDAGNVAATFTYGVADPLDVAVGLPLQWALRREGGVTVSDANGLADLALDAKWRFYEKGAFSFALKPGLTVPSGSEPRGLGAGLATYHAFAIMSAEVEPWTLHLNAGYVRNANRAGERQDLWHFSLAPTVAIRQRLQLVTNFGADRNPDPAAKGNPMYLVGGAIFSVTESFDVDFGVKGGLNQWVPDRTYLAGITLRM